MRPLLAILLILLLGISQSARHLAYLECRLMQDILSLNASCDCEKLLSDTGTSDTDIPGTMHRLHFHPDDFFHPPAAEKLTHPLSADSRNRTTGPEKTMTGNPDDYWQPPEC